MLESEFERKWCAKATKKGWLCIKNIHLSINGIPDRTLLKDGKVLFVEFKAKKGKLSEIQKYRIKQLRAMNFHVLIIFADHKNMLYNMLHNSKSKCIFTS